MRLRAILVTAALALASPAGADREGEPEGFSEHLVRAAIERTKHPVIYDGSYRSIPYPNGDVPANVGVCTDVVIRAYRELGIDLQRDVHEEMKAHFGAFPDSWGLRLPDPNIDHRRVPNLQAFFARKGLVLPATQRGDDYVAGDLVTWTVAGNLPHIGIVVDRRSADGMRPLVVHNIGRGPRIEDMLFSYPITGHYRYYGSRTRRAGSRFGFEMTLPPGWVAFSPIRGEEYEYFLRTEGVGENLTIRRRRVQIPSNPFDFAEMCSRASERYARSYGRPVEVRACELRRVAGRPATYLEIEGVQRGTWVRQYQVEDTPEAVIANPATFQRAHASDVGAELDSIIASLRFHPYDGDSNDAPQLSR